MKPTHIEHLGIAVNKLDEVIPYYEQLLGTKCYSIEEVVDQKVRTAFFKCGQTKIELLEPTSEESTIAKWLEKNPKGGVHHVAFLKDTNLLYGDKKKSGDICCECHKEFVEIADNFFDETNKEEAEKALAERSGE